jgi:uncharacterized protein (TIGR03435 family)
MRNVTLMSCLRWANDLHDYQISGPSSLGVDRYDITARAGSPVGDDQLKLMLRALLADRFRLTSHRETRERQVYMLTIARSGPRLRAADESGPGVTRPKVRATMSELAGVLSGPMMAPVVDRTGLDGRYDFVLDMSEFMPAGASKTGVDIPGVVMTAVQEQLGLQLKPGQARIEFLVVDRVERPTQD